jgi:NhaP-type Na+/H+ and K+/H+ antiporter
VDEGLLLLIVGGVLAASIVVAFGATRAGVPSLVAFLGLGMLLGSDGLGGIEFDDADLARKVGVVALAAILFEGGLATSWRRLREVAVPATVLGRVNALDGLDSAYVRFTVSVSSVKLGEASDFAVKLLCRLLQVGELTGRPPRGGCSQCCARVMQRRER